jgi:uncharacterized protein (DUF1015 family)
VQILPSGDQSGPGLALSPFRGLRYAQDRVSGLAEVTSPPYDVIARGAEDHLRASDPHNVVRLILPRQDRDNPGAAYADAARTLRAWLAGGILVPDPEPALYVYEQSLPAGPVLQRGLIGALALAPLGDGPILPHEDVVPGPVTGRRQLMEATDANLEPIFLLYEEGTTVAARAGNGVAGRGNGAAGERHTRGRTGDGGAGRDGAGAASAATRLTTHVAATREPLLSVDTDDGTRHRLWAVTDPAEHAIVAADLATRQALIADGHHRYAAYLQLQARKRAGGAGAGPWDCGLALLVDSDAFPPHIGAIHRVIAGLDPAEAVRLARSAFGVREMPGLGLGPAQAALDALREVGDGVAFLIVGDGRAHLLTDPDPAAVVAAMPERSERWRQLSASVLQELLLGKLWGIADASERVQIHHDAGEALAAVAAPGSGTAVLCPPLTAADVRGVAADGERVPRKSTSFAPKPRTGLVMRSFGLS